MNILPNILLNLPVRERAFLFASIDLQIAAEKRAHDKLKR